MVEEIIENANKFPEIFYCRHMLPGVVEYENERIMVDTDSMKRAAPSFVGKPIYVNHQKVDLKNIDQADGFVVECFYNELDGWEWAKCLVTSDAAHRAIANKWSVSNAYVPTDWEGDGQHLNVDYDRKIRNYEFTHLAIVPNPRYEEAKIFTPDQFKDYQAGKRKELDELTNSKPQPRGEGLMFFRTKNEEIKAGDTVLDTDFTEIINDDGTKETVTVAQLKAARKAEKAAELANSKKNEKMVDDDEEIEVDGEKVNMGALKECYKNMKSVKKNEDDEKKKKEKENAEEKKKEDEEKEKENAKKAKEIAEIANAGGKKITSSTGKIETMQDKQKRGAQKYGAITK